MPEGHALDALRAALPVWVVWLGPIGWIVFGAIFGAVVTWVPMRVARGAVARSMDAHWTERARQRAPFAMAMQIGSFVALVVAALLAYRGTGPLSPISPRVVATLAAAASYAAAVYAADVVARPVAERVIGWTAMLRLLVANWVLLRTGLFVAFLALVVIPTSWGVTAWLVLLGAAALNLWLMSGRCVPLLQAVGIITPATEVEERLAEEVAQAVGRPAPVVRRLRTPVANAMALFLQKSLLITGPAREILSDEELRSVLAHEVGHLMEPRSAALRRVAMGLLPLALPAAVPLGFTFGPLWALLALVALLTVLFLLRHVSVRQETEADRVAHEHEGEDGAYARALEALYRFNLTPAVTRAKFKSHPDLYDRLLAAGVEPEYARPEPPPNRRSVRLVGFAATLVLAVVAVVTPEVLELRAWRGKADVELALAAKGGRGWLFERLGWVRLAAGDREMALLAARAAREVAPADPWLGLAVVNLLGSAGGRDEARALLARLGAEHPASSLTSPYLAAEFAERSRDYGAPDAAERFLAAGTDLLDQQGGGAAWLLIRLGALWRAAGHAERSQALLARAVDAASSVTEDDAWMFAELALLARSLDREDLAAHWLERALVAAEAGGFLAELQATVEARSADDGE